MKVDDIPFLTIWRDATTSEVVVLDQMRFPHGFETLVLDSLETAARAISEMRVRGAPLMGATAAYGVALAMRDDPSDAALAAAVARRTATRPTAINLRWVLERARRHLAPVPPEGRAQAAFGFAARLRDEDVEINARIGEHGLEVIREIARAKRPGEPVRVLTHCNAGWLATVDWGTATAPIYNAHDARIAVEVRVDETRPRNQGAALTAWELGRHGVPHKAIVDNAGGHLMQHGLVDLVLVGSDRITAQGDVCNKIGTYLKALAAHDNGVPFYLALPSPTIDFSIRDGRDIPIEERDGREVRFVLGRTASGAVEEVDILPPGSEAFNPAFDVTPARLVTGLITEHGVIPATTEGIVRVRAALDAAEAA